MRTPAILRTAAMGALLAVAGGCATLRSTVGSYATGPDGIARPQQRLREALAHDDFATALAWREDDALLRALGTATAAYYAAQYPRAALLLDSAALLADDRITASLSRDALAMVTNDMARPYQPRRTERLFIPYYAMLAWTRMGEWASAAVEARRIGSLLAQYADSRDDGERATHAAMQHLAAAVLERAGDRDAADVGYRAAQAIHASFPGGEDGAPPGEGEVLVVIEHGFVAHRVTESIDIHVGDGDDDDRYWMSVAYPVLRRAHVRLAPVYVAATEPPRVEALRVTASVDDAASADERRDRAAFVVRAAGRAATKYAITRTVREKKGATAGKLVNLGVGLLERADVRSWHLLPRALELRRLVLPAGDHDLRITVGAGTSSRVVELGRVAVTGGAPVLLSTRLWDVRAARYAAR